ncbi:AAA family ATPase [Massilia sp. G4R7]|uniref:AAA family ATPase n=1 Tax=Massilia phyllostachyos TaxID=2898585 RepID=A0ABS8QBJ2_9BURK|nr:AAA family ATPase [Massilia phyllostachyos]MCD2519135.1 AAA family ATPase [Massilia phyllostachyos]
MNLFGKPYLRSVSVDPRADIDLDTYPFTIPAVRDMGVIDMHPDVTFFVGENGAGKSTVLEAIAVALGLPAEGGPRSVHRPQQEVSPLERHLKLVKGARQSRHAWFLRAESMFNVFSYMDEVGGERRNGGGLHRRSHGEAFAELLQNFQPGGLYLLDEPEAALSPNRQLGALCIIDELVKKDAQFIIATHSPILLAYPRAAILSFDDTGITPVAYQDTEHYATTRDFLNHYPRRLQQLFDDE